jgi:hypothetical protein
MADKRPGGLTALAVFNFIFGGFGIILTLLALLVVGAVDVASDVVANETMDPEGAKAMAEVSSSLGVLYFSLVLSLIGAALLITSGVGYLKQKLFLGRKLGNTYAGISLVNTVVTLAMIGEGFGIGSIIGLIYPILTLALLNTTFKEDLVN